jgi:hypothetical protein
MIQNIWKVSDKGIIFNDSSRKAFFAGSAGKVGCVLSHTSISIVKKYNIRHHYEREHEGMGKIKSVS